MAADPVKGTDLAKITKKQKKALDELAVFMKKNVRPLLKKSKSKMEDGLREFKAPETGKGLKNLLTFIADQVSFIANKSK